MKFYKKRLSAFTLLENVVALLAIALSILVIQGMTTLITKEIAIIQQSDEQNWQVFCQLLRREFETVSLKEVTTNSVLVSTPDGLRRYGVREGTEEFRKTNRDGKGYQPMLFGVAAIEISKSQNVVTFNFIFKKGRDKLFIYAFSKGE